MGNLKFFLAEANFMVYRIWTGLSERGTGYANYADTNAIDFLLFKGTERIPGDPKILVNINTAKKADYLRKFDVIDTDYGPTIVSPRLIEILKPCIDFDFQFFRVEFLQENIGEYYALHVLRIIDLFDWEKTQCRPLFSDKPEDTSVQIDQPVWRSDLPQFLLTKAFRTKARIYASDTFADAFKKHKLRGLRFY
jgi:hypothetical protein